MDINQIVVIDEVLYTPLSAVHRSGFLHFFLCDRKQVELGSFCLLKNFSHAKPVHIKSQAHAFNTLFEPLDDTNGFLAISDVTRSGTICLDDCMRLR